MKAPTFTTEEVLSRLEVLYHALESEGWYVKANTAWLAMEEIKRLTEKRPRGRPRTGFDKKTYDRERIRRIREEKRAANSAD